VPSTTELIGRAVTTVRDEVPAFANLKLVVGLELSTGGLTGPASSERFRIELPGPEVSEGEAEDARLELAIPKAMFDLLAAEGGLADWKDAFHYGHLQVSGDERVKRLLGRAIEVTQP
jgi:hypothetical protein